MNVTIYFPPGTSTEAALEWILDRFGETTAYWAKHQSIWLFHGYNHPSLMDWSVTLTHLDCQ